MLECFDAEGDDSRHIRCGAAGGDAQRNDWTETMRSRALPCFWQVVNIFWWMMFSCWRLPVVQQMPATLWRNEFNKCPDYFLFFSLAMRHWIRCLCWLRSIFINLKWYFFMEMWASVGAQCTPLFQQSNEKSSNFIVRDFLWTEFFFLQRSNMLSGNIAMRFEMQKINRSVSVCDSPR